jgi:transposase-like protein
MRAENGLPETLQEAVIFFANEENAFEFLMTERWPNGVVSCPRCNSEKVALIKTRHMWRCNGCKKQFSLKIGTVMEDSPIGLDKWLCGFWLIVNAKNGISSYEIHRSLGVTQKTAWFLLHRIRLAMQNGGLVSFRNQVEADETFIGAKARNVHKGKRKAKGTGPVTMTPVMGILERTQDDKHSRVFLKVTETRRKPELQQIVREIVEKGSELYTDAFCSYDGLESDYTHQVIDHLESYAQGRIHTNGLENFWSLLKRALKGTYVNVEPFHLFRYCDEQAFRFNERKDNDQGRFLTAIRGMFGKGLRYAKLIGQEGGGSLPPETTKAW